MKRKIKDCLEFVVDNRGKTPPTTDDGFDLVEINAITGNGKYPNYKVIKKHVSLETFEHGFRTGHPIIGDILIPTVGTLDAIAMADRSNICIAQNLIALRPKQNECDSDFLYYLLCNRDVRLRLLNLDIGGVQPSIKVPHLLNLEIEIPDLKKQKQIGVVLSSFDNKIKANNELIESLEETIDLLLNNLLDNDNELTSIGDNLYIKGRIGWKGLKKSEYLENSLYRIINGESLMEDGIDWNKTGFISQERYLESPEIMLREGDILLSKDGTIGKIGYVDSLDVKTTVASGIFVIRNLDDSFYSNQFVYYLLKSKLFKNFIVTRTEGSVIPHLYQKDFVDFKFKKPSLEQMKIFNETTKPMFNMVVDLKRENKELSNTRDELLSKLISGMIDTSSVKLEK